MQARAAHGARSTTQVGRLERADPLGGKAARPVDAATGNAPPACTLRRVRRASRRPLAGRCETRQGFFALSGLTFLTAAMGTSCAGSAPQSSPLAGGGYNMDHSSMLLLFDRDGEYAGLIGYQEEDARALASLRKLLGS